MLPKTGIEIRDMGGTMTKLVPATPLPLQESDLLDRR